MIMYRFALNKDGKRISIDDVSSKDEKREFICPECKGILNPRALDSGSVTKHFYHLNKEGEGSAGQCSGESYLHWISKELLAECLRESDSFIVKYATTESCRNKEAATICVKNVIMEIDIVKEYPYVYVEKRDEVYIPDIMLKNDKGEKIYIEIYKSSASSDKKRNCGNKIIQIKVQHEKDIESILQKKVIEGNSKSVEFINFKPGNFDCGGDCDYVDQLDYTSYEDSYRYSAIKRIPVSIDEMMKNFCLKMRNDYTYDDKRSNEFSVVYKGRNLWYVSCCNEFFFVSHFEMYHIVYNVVGGEIVHLAKDLTFSGLDYTIKQYIVERGGML